MRTLIISEGAPTMDESPNLCAVRVEENDGTIVHSEPRVNYGRAITGLMEQFGCARLTYTEGARWKFLGPSLRKSDPLLD